MQVTEHVALAALNTLRVAARARYFVRIQHPGDVAAVREDRRLAGLPWLVLGGGSNVLFAGDFSGVVLANGTTGRGVVSEDDAAVVVTAGGGENWHRLVQFCVAGGWGGIENLSLIPGSVGAAPIQNIGAYGAQLSDVLVSVTAVELATGQLQELSAAQCQFGYRDSVFKRALRDQLLIDSVTVRLAKQPRLELGYAGVRDELAAAGAAEPYDVAAVSAAIVRLRRRKLPDPAALPNAGSFFKNPVVSAAALGDLQRRMPQVVARAEGDRYKLSAAQLIEHCGLRGKRFGRAGVAEQHALVLVNHGGATGAEVLAAAAAVEATVADRLGIRLEREVRVIGGDS